MKAAAEGVQKKYAALATHNVDLILKGIISCYLQLIMQVIDNQKKLSSETSGLKLTNTSALISLHALILFTSMGGPSLLVSHCVVSIDHN